MRSDGLLAVWAAASGIDLATRLYDRMLRDGGDQLVYIPLIRFANG